MKNKFIKEWKKQSGGNISINKTMCFEMKRSFLYIGKFWIKKKQFVSHFNELIGQIYSTSQAKLENFEKLYHLINH